MSSDLDFAYETTRRLNRLIASDPGVLPLIQGLTETRVNIPESLADHPTLHCQQVNDGVEDYYQVGWLGVLNGLIDTQPKGVEGEQYGYIWMVDDEKFSVVHNKVTVDELLETPKEGVMYQVSGTSDNTPCGHSSCAYRIKGDNSEIGVLLREKGCPEGVFPPEVGTQVEVYGCMQKLEVFGRVEWVVPPP